MSSPRIYVHCDNPKCWYNLGHLFVRLDLKKYGSLVTSDGKCRGCGKKSTNTQVVMIGVDG